MTLTQDRIEQFLDSIVVNGGSLNTAKAYGADLRGLLAEVGPTTTTEEFELKAATYLTATRTKVEPRTTRRRLASFRAYGKWCGLATPLSGYRPPKPAAPEPHPLAEGIDGVVAMMNASYRPDQRALVAFCGLMGLRVGEAVRVRPADVNVADGTLTVMGKGAKQRVLPITEAAWNGIKTAYEVAVAKRAPTIIKFGERRASEIIKMLAVQAGLADGHKVATHDLRSTFLTTVYDKTKDIRATQELAGHASIETTVGYTGISMQTKRAAAEVT